MNNGKICISVCAKTADELIEQIQRAEDLADVIEIRFDCLDENEFDLALPKIGELNCSKPFLATFRPKHEGAIYAIGFREFKNKEEEELVTKALDYRFEGWEKIFDIENVKYLDFEEDILMLVALPNNEAPLAFYCFSEGGEKKALKRQIIFSEHLFNLENIQSWKTNLSDYINSSYQFMLNEDYESQIPEKRNDIIKIAIQTSDITDTIPIWQLLNRAKSENKEIIPIAMGESGKWTRILGLAHGAFMTYASLDSDKETAPGQVTAKDLIEVYRAKELDEKTEVYGILGSNTSVSMSPYIHNLAFKYHKLNSVFVPLQVHDLDEFIKRMVKPETREIDLNFKGFSVTIPHKQSIIKHLDYIDETAEKIGAVNTVKIIDGKLYGYNTDAHGFIEPLKQVYGDLDGVKVAVLGAGGAARACVYALKKENADVTILARNIEKAKELAETFEVKLEHLDQEPQTDFDIFINTTPLGMKGKVEGETPLTAEQIKDAKLIYDLVYIPFQTAFLAEADKVDVPKIGGMAMLVAQALEQQKIWTGLDAPMKEISQEVLRRLQ